MPSRFLHRALCACGFKGAALLLAPSELHAGGEPAAPDTIVVTAPRDPGDGPQSATEGYVSHEQLGERPVARAGELLEFVPGLMVTQHSGEGKANQYFLRGFNLDHGTDFYTEVDGVPVNMRTHAHGQGYADINFIIPELIDSIEYRKGPYDADVGDFASAGSAELRYVDELPQNLARLTLGEYGYRNALLAASPRVLDGSLLLGAQTAVYDGPFELDQDVRKLATIARFNRGTPREGASVSLMTYRIRYNAPDQIPQRAVDSGEIDRFASIDTSDGGSASRYSLAGEWRSGDWRAQGYAMRYRMRLFSNFSYFLNDPVDGDQFSQVDERSVYGATVTRSWRLPTSIAADLRVGLQTRYDDIGQVGLHQTRRRERLSTVRMDRVDELSSGLFATSAQRWAPWLRTTAGLRLDGYSFDVDSDRPENSGDERDAILSPKLAVILGPWARTQVFVNYGEGFHSNDARGLTTTVDPVDGVTPQDKVDALVKGRGGEIGISSRVIPDLSVAASLWTLNFDSELVYVGDAGANEPSGRSRRRGLELAAYYQPLPTLIVDLDYAYSRARLESPQGHRIPNSISHVVGIGLALQETRGWSGGMRVRHLGAGPLTEDGKVRSKATTVVNAQATYRLGAGLRAGVEVLNLFDSHDNDITYFYASRLPGEPAEGVEDVHFHPVEARAVRMTASYEF